MLLSEEIRKIAFWGYDYLKGSRIRRHVRDLENAFDDPEKGKRLADERLERFLDHSCKTTPFYKKFAGKKLEEFPVIQKKTIKDNYDDFLSCAYDKTQLVSTTTSGSYGTPFRFYITKEKRCRQLAEILFFNGWAGYRVGMRYAQIRVYKRSKFSLCDYAAKGRRIIYFYDYKKYKAREFSKLAKLSA